MSFDPTLSLGNLLTILALVAGWIGLANRNAIQSALLKASHDSLAASVSTMKTEAKADALAIKNQVDTLSSKVESLAVIQQRLADGKERMDGMEERLRAVEGATIAERRAH